MLVVGGEPVKKHRTGRGAAAALPADVLGTLDLATLLAGTVRTR